MCYFSLVFYRSIHRRLSWVGLCTRFVIFAQIAALRACLVSVRVVAHRRCFVAIWLLGSHRTSSEHAWAQEKHTRSTHLAYIINSFKLVQNRWHQFHFGLAGVELKRQSCGVLRWSSLYTMYIILYFFALCVHFVVLLRFVANGGWFVMSCCCYFEWHGEFWLCFVCVASFWQHCRQQTARARTGS